MSPTPGMDLRIRPAGASVIIECLAAQRALPSRSWPARVLGVSPLSDESRPWYLGALGELEVGRRLTALNDAWLVLHAVPFGGSTSDIDHVVIGLGGVFTINTKFHEGKDIWVGSKRLLVGGQSTNHLRNARFEAARAAKQLSAAAGERIEVTPILAFVGARQITIKERPSDVVILRERELARWFRKRRPSISAEQLARIVTAATDASTWHREPSKASVDLDAFAALQSEVRIARLRRIGWACGGLAAIVAGMAAMWAPLSTALAG